MPVVNVWFDKTKVEVKKKRIRMEITDLPTKIKRIIQDRIKKNYKNLVRNPLEKQDIRGVTYDDKLNILTIDFRFKKSNLKSVVKNPNLKVRGLNTIHYSEAVEWVLDNFGDLAADTWLSPMTKIIDYNEFGNFGYSFELDFRVINLCFLTNDGIHKSELKNIEHNIINPDFKQNKKQIRKKPRRPNKTVKTIK